MSPNSLFLHLLLLHNHLLLLHLTPFGCPIYFTYTLSINLLLQGQPHNLSLLPHHLTLHLLLNSFTQLLPMLLLHQVEMILPQILLPLLLLVLPYHLLQLPPLLHCLLLPQILPHLVTLQPYQLFLLIFIPCKLGPRVVYPNLHSVIKLLLTIILLNHPPTKQLPLILIGAKQWMLSLMHCRNSKLGCLFLLLLILIQ